MDRDRDSEVNRDTYDASRIDWERLRKYALRVSKETRLPLSAPINYEKTVRKEVAIEKQIGGIYSKTRGGPFFPTPVKTSIWFDRSCRS